MVEETRTTLYVDNIPGDSTYNEVLAVFKKFGKVVRLELPLAEDGRGIQGSAYVQYSKSWKAEAALRSSECSLHGQHFHMEWAEAQPVSKKGSKKRFRVEARALNDKGKTLALLKVPDKVTAEQVKELFSYKFACEARRPEHKKRVAFVDFKSNKEAKEALEMCKEGDIKFGETKVIAQWAKFDKKKHKNAKKNARKNAGDAKQEDTKKRKAAEKNVGDAKHEDTKKLKAATKNAGDAKHEDTKKLKAAKKNAGDAKHEDAKKRKATKKNAEDAKHEDAKTKKRKATKKNAGDE